VEYKPVLEEIRQRLSELVKQHGLAEQKILVRIGTLTPEEAIGNPARNDYPILEGKEVMIEADFLSSYGQAFTDRPQNFSGTISDLLNLDMDNSGNRAIFIAAANAITSHLGIAKGMRHCRNDEPERCAALIAEQLHKDFGNKKIALIGLQPAILDHLSSTFGPENIKCSDLNPKNIGSVKSGIMILDGKKDNIDMVKWADIVFITSSAIVNGSIDDIRKIALELNKMFIIFGISGAGAAALLNINRLCFFGH
jgi:uncharacterized protein (DUF4213/DUF364 family)